LNVSTPKPEFAADMPPIHWRLGDLATAFTAYLERVSIGNHGSDWSLFRLNVTATQARLARDFDELLALEHVRGFTPLPHQVETAKQVLQQLHGRAILADEVGLGKTIEAGLIIKEYLLRGLARKVLVLAPASLVLQWTRELNEKFRIPAYAQKNEWNWTQCDVLVASLDTAKREPHRSAVLNVQWDVVVVDEAHKRKNNRTKNWQMVNQIPNKYMLLLTATPIQNDLKELHTLITLLKPGHLGNSHEFAAQHLQSARQPKDPAQLKSQLGNVMIRNRRLDGATALPQRHVSVVPLELSPEERTLYDAVQGFLKAEYANRVASRGSVLPLITLQREICSSPYAAMITLERMYKRAKSEAVRDAVSSLLRLAEAVKTYTKVEKVLEMIDQIDDKCIVFTEYRATQDFLLYMLRRRGVPAVPFRGGFKRSKKDWMKDLFAKKMRVLVATESGGEGINLQFCHHMINFDLPWNPMKLEQRIGRIHRLGQEHEVHIYNLSTQNTIEAHIVELLQEKIRMFELVIGELDYIVGDYQLGDKLEKNILEWAMTSKSDAELKQRLNEYGDTWLRHIEETSK
jgi:SNF2 family DNA or RNA helicase